MAHKIGFVTLKSVFIHIVSFDSRKYSLKQRKSSISSHLPGHSSPAWKNVADKRVLIYSQIKFLVSLNPAVTQPPLQRLRSSREMYTKESKVMTSEQFPSHKLFRPNYTGPKVISLPFSDYSLCPDYVLNLTTEEKGRS